VTLRADSSLVSGVCPSPNFGPRTTAGPTMLLLHYTGVASVEQAIRWLSHPESKVSCHYVVGEQGSITQLVAERERAWHAGVAQWAGERDINSASIGIEVHNPGHELGYPDFPEAQMAAVAALCSEIGSRYSIRPERVLAHSDVAPARKIDPGEKFDWGKLARAGVGHWVEPAPIAGDCLAKRGDRGPSVDRAQALLCAYGYGLVATGVLDVQTEFVVKAFQRHFRPARVDGRIDRSTIDTLERLLEALPSS